MMHRRFQRHRPNSCACVDLAKVLFFTTQAFVRHLRATERPGKAINISSVHEELPFPGFASYCASNGGVRMLTRTLAIELGPLGITVNGIAHGAIATTINANEARIFTKSVALGELICPSSSPRKTRVDRARREHLLSACCV